MDCTFLHAADIHLDSPLRGLESYADAPVEEIRGVTRRAFDNLIALALNEQVDFLLIAGDLYDSDWRDYQTGLYCMACLGRLTKAGIRVFLVSGNHDAASQITRFLPLPPGVYRFPDHEPASVVLDQLGVAIHGQSYARRTQTDNLARRYPAAVNGLFNIGLLHTSLTGRPGHDSYAPCSPADLLSKGYDYWALGHVHQREIVSKSPWIVYPGNLQGRSIKETGEKGATLVRVRHGQIVAVEMRGLDGLRFVQAALDCGAITSRDQLHQQVRQLFEGSWHAEQERVLAVRLQLTGSSSLHQQLMASLPALTEEIRSIATAGGHLWLEKLVARTTDPSPYTDDPASGPVGELLADWDRQDFSDTAILQLAPEIGALRAMLPAELPAALPLDEEQLRELKEQVRQLLASRLLGDGTAP